MLCGKRLPEKAGFFRMYRHAFIGNCENMENVSGDMMYRIEKVLNHNTVMAIHQDDHKEVLIMGKGVGFGRKVAERIEVRPEDRLYSLQK